MFARNVGIELRLNDRPVVADAGERFAPELRALGGEFPASSDQEEAFANVRRVAVRENRVLREADQGRRRVVVGPLPRREVRARDEGARENRTSRDEGRAGRGRLIRLRFLLSLLFLRGLFAHDADPHDAVPAGGGRRRAPALAREFGFEFVAHQFAALLLAKLEGIVDLLFVLPLGGVRRLSGDLRLRVGLLCPKGREFVRERVEPFAPLALARRVGLLRLTLPLKALNLLLQELVRAVEVLNAPGHRLDAHVLVALVGDDVHLHVGLLVPALLRTLFGTDEREVENAAERRHRQRNDGELTRAGRHLREAV